ncbi:hypothetical protein HY450_03955 [Candidatus Pacearchaeota archaeon]|nr:hypothetical protein [Candidatus Pacearchaeota archaeon]
MNEKTRESRRTRVAIGLAITIKGLEEREGIFITPQGLFVEEGHIDRLTDAFKEHRITKTATKTKTKVSESREDLHLILSKIPYYLINEKCRVGYSSRFDNDIFDKLELPSLEGKLVSCSAALHMMDPLFHDNKEVELLDEKGFVAKFILERGRYKVHQHAFSRFKERAGEKPETFKKSERSQLQTERGALTIMHACFSRAEPMENKNGVAQIFKYHLEGAEYWKNGEWIYVVTSPNVIRTFYHERNWTKRFRKEK